MRHRTQIDDIYEEIDHRHTNTHKHFTGDIEAETDTQEDCDDITDGLDYETAETYDDGTTMRAEETVENYDDVITCGESGGAVRVFGEEKPFTTVESV
ncbi:uncharacterized protein [Paramisgurnus dabryanus]|uniref:uncharacterized protein n=1 Tax=Paramisgurnus dabryanus TaxID=90735 RepID=UPI003CCF6D69